VNRYPADLLEPLRIVAAAVIDIGIVLAPWAMVPACAIGALVVRC
jgi:hypothetical protein